MNPISKDIATLIAQGAPDWNESDWLPQDWNTIGDILGSTMFVGREPMKPDDSITIFDTPGRPMDLTLDGADPTVYEYGAVQIRVRSNNYDTGWGKANEIKNLLHGRANETIGGSLYTVISCSSGPAMLEWDENNRIKFIINFEIQRRSL